MTKFAVSSCAGDPSLEVPPLKIEELPKRNAPVTMPKPPFLAGIFGSRGSGKTTSMINMLRMYDKMKAFDHIVIWSPTFEKDPKFEAWVESKPHAKLELIANFTEAKFNEYLQKFDQNVRDYLEYRKAKKAYDKYAKSGIKSLNEDELLLLYQYDFGNPDVYNKFPDGIPSHCMVFDDQVGNKKIYRNDSAGAVGQFALRHRHYLCSVFFLSQADNNGIPKQLRKNLNVCMFFANKSDKMKQEMAEEMNSHISPKEFIDCWNFATEEDHAFFMCIFDAEQKEHRFRKNFDTLIFPVAEEEDEQENPFYEDYSAVNNEDDEHQPRRTAAKRSAPSAAAGTAKRQQRQLSDRDPAPKLKRQSAR